MKRKILMLFILVLIVSFATSCGSNPVVQETSQGVILEDKAKDSVDKMSGSAEEADDMLENVGDQ